MQAPRVFTKMCRAFYSDNQRDFVTEAGALNVIRWMTNTAEESLTVKEREELRAFLDSLLSGAYSDKEIQVIYDDTDPTLGAEPASSFLKLLRQALN